jgi:peptidoglycan LD-endopeptidase CwlK
MSFRLGTRSQERLKGVHPDLVKVVERAIQLTPVDFTVLEGLRTEARQRELVARGASKTMNSRHLTGHAVDLGAFVGGQVRWDWPLYHRIAAAVKAAAAELEVPIEWGGDWRSFKDGPHWQLPWKQYPVERK